MPASTEPVPQLQRRFTRIREFLRQIEKLIREELVSLLLTLAGLIVVLKLLFEAVAAVFAD